MKKGLAIFLAVLFVVSLTAVAASAHWCGGHSGWGGGFGGGWGWPYMGYCYGYPATTVIEQPVIVKKVVKKVVCCPPKR
jgi:hypothetical protein